MNKILGIFGLLIFVCLFTTVMSESFVSEYNLYNITRWSALFGILSIGVAFVIITGGIDLSIGSVVGLIACLLPMLVNDYGFTSAGAIVTVLLISGGIGLLHGLLITRLDLQPFVVTLCGLLFYRGFARWMTNDATLGFGQEFDDDLRLLAIGKPCSWATLLLISGIATILFGVWKSMSVRPSENSDSLTAIPANVSAILIGVMISVVGSSRFWQGWETYGSTASFIVGDYRIRGIACRVPEGAESMPSLVMTYAGTLLFLPLLVLFLRTICVADFRRSLKPVIGVAVSLLVLMTCVWMVVPFYREIGSNDLWQIGVVRLSGDLLKTLIMLTIFLVVGSVIGSIGWLLSVAASISRDAKSQIPLLVCTSVMVLLGRTQFAATMVPMPMLFLAAMAIAASIFLNRTIFGRYLLALGRNEEAARYSGINTKRMIVVAYVLCALAAGVGGILFSLDVNSVQPSGFGNFYELYAIAAAVLGGCSLRGGEGNVIGVVIGAAVMRVLYNAINILGISTQLEFAIIGLVILAGAIVDVVVKRIVAYRAALADAKRRHQDETPADP